MSVVMDAERISRALTRIAHEIIEHNRGLADVALVVYVRRLESFMMAPLWANLGRLDQWHRRIEERPAYLRAVVEWGDVTEAARRAHGSEAFGRMKEIWDAGAS